uniref:RRM domain-containing protein n=1 Tax=Leptobrachium leishanense TaxID=445787 RepID=A0A8C5Q491_9ANUR
MPRPCVWRHSSRPPAAARGCGGILGLGQPHCCVTSGGERSRPTLCGVPVTANMSDSGEQNYGDRESRSASRSGSARRSGKSASHSPNHSPARSRSKEGSRRSRSKSRSRSESRSRSRRSSRRHYTRSRTRSRSHRRSRSRSYSRDYRRRHSHSHSPMSNRRRHIGNRQCNPDSRVGRTNKWAQEKMCVDGKDKAARHANPDPNCCLGVFGLSLYTTERDLREVFSKYGPIADVSIVYDQQSRRSRGFSFVYFENVDDAKEAKERANGMELDGRRIRVDFSITKRPHTPTPGIYMGRPTYGSSRRRDYYDRGYDRGGYDDREYYSRSSYRRRSPSPYYSRGGYRSRSRSRSYSPRRY